MRHFLQLLPHTLLLMLAEQEGPQVKYPRREKPRNAFYGIGGIIPYKKRFEALLAAVIPSRARLNRQSTASQARTIRSAEKRITRIARKHHEFVDCVTVGKKL